MFFLHRLSYEARPEHELSRSHPQVLHRRGCLQIRRRSLLHHIPLQPAAESSPHRLDSFIGKAGRHNRDDAVREHDQHGAENTQEALPLLQFSYQMRTRNDEILNSFLMRCSSVSFP